MIDWAVMEVGDYVETSTPVMDGRIVAVSVKTLIFYHYSAADRDVICNLFENGGTNPLEAGAEVQYAQKMIQYQAFRVKLKLAMR